MLKKHALFTATLLCSASLYAIPIESRGLSQVDDSYATATAVNISNSSGKSNTTTNASTPTNINWQLMQKAEQLENDIRSLRGKIEEQDYEISQLKRDLQNKYAELDQRIELLKNQIDPDSATDSEEDNQQDISPSTNKPVENPNTLSTATKSTVQASTEDMDKAAYTVALEAYKTGGAKKAIAPMQNFIKNHPNSPYISNAYFWMAEFNLAIEPTNYVEAKKNFEIVANKYPDSAKASNAVYRLYTIALNVDKNSALANQYKNKLLTKYPKSEEAGFVKK
jgi:TolA-binding protein